MPADHAITDSYITTNEIGNAYFANDPRPAAIAFLLLTTDQQAWYFKKATKLIDLIEYQGLKLFDTQARQFPRKFLFSPEEIFPWGLVNVLIDAYRYGYISTSTPQFALDACCEEALALYNMFATTGADELERAKLQAQGVTSVSYDGTAETYAPGSGSQYLGLHSKEAFELLAPYIEMAPLII